MQLKLDKMRAVAITGLNQVEIIEMDRPAPGEGEILIRVRACALCTWEQRVFTGVKKLPLPHVGGHEIAGVIVEVGSGVDTERFPVGSKVAGRTLGTCGSCHYCRRGLPTQCIHTGKLRYNGPDAYGVGGFGEYICLPESAVWCFDTEKDFPELSLTEPLACVLNSIERARPGLGDDAVVIGGGIMGQLHIMLLQKMGLRTILSEPDPERRAFAKAHGCDILIDPMQENAVERVKAITGGRGADVVINTTAISSVMEQAVAMTARLGRCVAYSSQHPDRPIPVSPNWLHNTEAVLTGAVNPSIATFDRAVNLLNKGIIDVKDYISGIYPMEQAQQAFEAAIRPDTYRIVITMD